MEIRHSSFAAGVSLTLKLPSTPAKVGIPTVGNLGSGKETVAAGTMIFDGVAFLDHLNLSVKMFSACHDTAA